MSNCFSEQREFADDAGLFVKQQKHTNYLKNYKYHLNSNLLTRLWLYKIESLSNFASNYVKITILYKKSSYMELKTSHLNGLTLAGLTLKILF